MACQIGGRPMSAVPFIKFYPSDWLSEETLRLVPLAARGLWIDLLCLMAKSERRGYLTLKGGDKGGVNPGVVFSVNPTLAQIALLVGSTEAEIGPLIEALKQAGTCSVEAETGILFCRRMVRDTESYHQAVAHGSMGGNPRLRKRVVKGRVNPPVNLSRQPPLGSGFCDSSFSDSGSERGVGENHAGHATRRELPSWEVWSAYAGQQEPGWPERDRRSAFDHYEANGWRQKGGTTIRDWRAACRTCLNNWRERNGRTAPQMELTPEEFNGRRMERRG